MAGVRKTPLAGGNLQGYYINFKRLRVFFTGTSNKKDTLAAARAIEDDISLSGWASVPNPSQAISGASLQSWLLNISNGDNHKVAAVDALGVRSIFKKENIT